MEDGVRFTIEDLNLLRKICVKEKLPDKLIARLIDQERKLQGLSKRAGIISEIDKIFKEDWESEEQKISEIAAHNVTQ